jgi:hypothetical protein
MAMDNACFRGKRIKRPGWEKNIGEWVEGGIAYDPGGTYITQWNSFGLGFIDCIPVDHATVGQFTGWTVKDKAKVFDGDIVYDHDSNEHYRIMWSDTTFEWLACDDNGYLYSLIEFGNLNEVEVVGNIWDTPDLVEREEQKDGSVHRQNPLRSA